MERIFSRNVVVTLLLIAVIALLAPTVHALPPGFQNETILSGNLDEPVVLAELPDGAMLLAQKNGRIFRFDPREQPAQIRSFMQIPDIEWGGERGINGLVLDPNYAINGHFYVYYTSMSAARNRISRFTASGDWADPASEVMIWQDNENWSDCCHYGGGLAFGPDGRLYLATGEEFDGPQAQDLGRAGGKIIRINSDGSVPADNPFIDGPGGNLDEIWAYGLRNPFRAHWDLVANRLFLGEVGGNVQETAREDIHVGRAGANFGWPFCEGSCGNPAWDDPVYDYPHTAATPAGGAVVAGFSYYGSQFPFAYSGKFFFADYTQGWIKYLAFNADGSLASVNDFTSPGEWIGAPVYLMQSSDGALWYVDIIGSVGRIRYNAGNQTPVVQTATATPATGPSPLNVTFNATATDAEGDALTYHWLFGDGSEGDGASVAHSYAQNGVYTAYVQVSDGTSTTLSPGIRVSVGNPPLATITTPTDGTLFDAGQVINFSGTASDPDETIPAANYRWDILFVHNAHTHPTLSGHTGTSGTLTINTSGHDYHDSTAYRITLTVTDSDGLTSTATTTVYPRKVDLSLSTSPAGLPLFLDGVQLSTPIAYDTLVGFQHVVSAPATACVGGTTYSFSGWSDGGAATHSVTVPTQNTAVVAQYTPTAQSCSSLPSAGLVLKLESDTGVVSSNGVVQSWTDQSASGVILSAGGEPQLVANALNGRAALDFDGVNDRLSVAYTLGALPAGNATREVYAVVNYQGAGYGGIAWGSPGFNQTFGLGVDPEGKLMVQGWGPTNDFISTADGTGAGWLIQSATLAGDQLAQYLNGNLLASHNHGFDTLNNQLFIGAEIDGAPSVDMQVAAVLVYDRTLSAAERNAVYGYLNGKYFTQAPNQPPVANADAVSLASGASATLSVLANDQDSDGTLQPSSVLLTLAPQHGSAIVNANGTITYQHNGSSGTTDTFRYSVADDDGLRSNEATVTINLQAPAATLPAAGLVLHLEADSGVESTEAIVTAWRDQSGRGNDLAYAGDPRLATSPNGRPVLDFDGSAARLQRLGGLNGLPTGNADRSVILLANYRGVGDGGFAYGNVALNQTFGTIVNPQGLLKAHAWGHEYDAVSTTPGTGAGWLLQTVTLQAGQMSHYRDLGLIGERAQTYNTGLNQIVLGAEIDNAPHVDMQVAAVLVYNRALSTSERQAVYAYLQNKYLAATANQPPLALADTATVVRGGGVVIPVLANDSDPEGALNAASVAIVNAPASGVVSVNTTTGAITYTHGGASLTGDSFTYRVADAQGTYSEPATVSVSVDAPDATITIDAPLAGTIVTGSSVTLNYTITGSGADHLHLQLDGGPEVMVMDMSQTSFTFPDVAPGTHTISAQLADGNHNNIPGTLVSTTFEVQAAGSATLPGAGLVLHLEADTGVAVSGAQITGWSDQSGSGNHLTATGAPTRVTGVLNGRPVVDLPGSGAALQRIGGLSGLPTGAADRTVLLLASYRSAGYGGFAWGNVDFNDVFGTIVDPAGYLMTQGWGVTNDAATTTPGTGAGWLVQGALVRANELFQYKETTLIGSRAQVYTTGNAQLVLGAEIDSNPYVSMQVAAVLVYNRALSNAEYAQAVAYLQQKYLQAGSGNQAPLAVDDAASVASGESVEIAVLANDSDADGTLNPASVLITRDPAAATLVVNPATGAVLYQHNGSAGADSFDYQVSDNGGATSNTATVTVAVTAPDLPPTAAADSALVAVAGSVTVPVTLNDADPEGALYPASVTVVTPPAAGSLVNNGDGTLRYTHAGVTAGSDSFSYTVTDQGGLVSAPATVTIEAVAGVPAAGLALWLEGGAGALTATGNGVISAWLDQSAAGNHLAAAGSPLLAPGVANGRAVVDFDGVSAKLERAAGNALPTGAADRSVYLVVAYRSPGYGGFAFGQPSCNNLFGLGVSPGSRLMVQGWCSDFISAYGLGSGAFGLQAALLSGNVLDHYLNGQLIDRQTHVFDTLPGSILLGAEIDSNPFVSMQVAAVLVYNRALSTAEHDALTAYLWNRYIAP